MKISFSLPSKASARSLPIPTKAEPADDEEKPEYLNEFDPTLPAPKKLKVIPSLQNTWRPEAKMKNIKMTDSGLKFEPEVQPVGIEPDTKYGLNLRSSQAADSTEIDKTGEEASAEAELRKLREDIQGLPDEASLDAYESLPVEDFGAALLRGMGWSEGKGIGRAKDPVAPVEYVRRPGREGLGATPAPPVDKPQRLLKPGETKDSRKDLVAASGPDGRTRNVIEVGEKLVERQKKGVSLGKTMRIVDGRHTGLKGQIIEILQNDVVVRLLKSDEKVVVSTGEVANIGSVEEDACLKRLRDLRLGTGDGRDSSGGGRGADYSERVGNKTEHTSKNYVDSSDSAGNRVEKRADYTVKHESGADYKSRGEMRESADRLKKRPESHSRYGTTYHGNAYDTKARSYGRDDRKGKEDVERHKEDRSERGRDHGERDYDRREDYNRKERRSRREGREEVSGRARESRDKGRRVQSEGKKEQSVEEGRRNTESDAPKDEMWSKSKSELKEPVLETSWLVSHIRVRVISKGFKGGRLYLKKGRVLDVVDPTSCDLLMDENGEVVQGVMQAMLETALPKSGGLILVVGGKHKGALGKLLEKDIEKEVGLVQKEDTREVLTLRLDHIAEFIGDPMDMGY